MCYLEYNRFRYGEPVFLYQTFALFRLEEPGFPINETILLALKYGLIYRHAQLFQMAII